MSTSKNGFTAMMIVVLSATAVLTMGASSPQSTRYAKLLEAIRQVESRGNPNAVGDNGKAIGSYQIWRTYWQDAVEHDKSIGGVYENCKNDAYAKRIILAYWDRYAPKDATDEQLARIHNGGPKGHLRSGTLKYWTKVKKEFK